VPDRCGIMFSRTDNTSFIFKTAALSQSPKKTPTTRAGKKPVWSKAHPVVERAHPAAGLFLAPSHFMGQKNYLMVCSSVHEKHQWDFSVIQRSGAFSGPLHIMGPGFIFQTLHNLASVPY